MKPFTQFSPLNPLKLRPYGAVQICLLLLLFFDAGTQFPRNEKITIIIIIIIIIIISGRSTVTLVWRTWLLLLKCWH